MSVMLLFYVLYMLKILKTVRILINFFLCLKLEKSDEKNTAKPSGLDGGLCFHLFVDVLSFDDVIATSDNLSHPTANRPKMPGRRLPSRFNSSSPVSIFGDVL